MHGTEQAPSRAVRLKMTGAEACAKTKIRVAVLEDAPAMGRMMVDSSLSAHRGQMPDAAWQQRVDEWTPEVSARGWAGAITDQAEGNAARDVLLVAEDDSGVLSALVSGTAADDDPSGSIAEIEALYVLPGSARPRDRGSLLRAAASELANLSFSVLRLAVLTANLPNPAVLRSDGGRAAQRVPSCGATRLPTHR